MYSTSPTRTSSQPSARSTAATARSYSSNRFSATAALPFLARAIPARRWRRASRRRRSSSGNCLADRPQPCLTRTTSRPPTKTGEPGRPAVGVAGRPGYLAGGSDPRLYRQRSGTSGHASMHESLWGPRTSAARPRLALKNTPCDRLCFGWRESCSAFFEADGVADASGAGPKRASEGRVRAKAIFKARATARPPGEEPSGGARTLPSAPVRR